MFENMSINQLVMCVYVHNINVIHDNFICDDFLSKGIVNSFQTSICLINSIEGTLGW